MKYDLFGNRPIDFEKVLADSKEEERRFYFFHVESKDKHEPVGSAGYTVTEFTPVGQLVHAGYFSFPMFWSNGYITEAFARIIEFAFTERDTNFS